MINILVAENDGNGFLVRFDRAEKPIFMLATSAFKQVVGRESREFDEQDKVWLIEETAKANLERFWLVRRRGCKPMCSELPKPISKVSTRVTATVLT